ncbi:MAG: DUF4956 domain-containing protein [Oscillospiraceae bacterium]|nr:DUF4956 domain-containing protein [Oscillospiraceae bacterium]
MFKSILSGDITLVQFLVCSLASAGAGLLTALCYMFRNRYSKNFVATLILLPIMVQSVILLVNGNVGTGVAVLGAFSLIRFRSVPGNSRDIAAIFLSMAVGIATGMGQVIFAFIMTAIVGVFMILLSALNFGNAAEATQELKITVPEDLDFEGSFEEILDKYTRSYRLESTRTTNMGSLYELRYEICMKKDKSVKSMIDELRTRNGNLSISCGRPVMQEGL